MAKRLPARYPKWWPGVLGPIRIKLVKDLKDDDGNELWGWAIYVDREILINADVLKGKDRINMWRVFFHEVGHFWMEDTGLNAIYREKKEREMWCDVYATGRVAELLGLK